MGNYLVSSDNEVFVSSVEEVCGELFFEAEDEGALDGKINKGSYIKAWAYIPTLDSTFWHLTQNPVDYGEYLVHTWSGVYKDGYFYDEEKIRWS